MGFNADPDPGSQTNADPYGSESVNQVYLNIFVNFFASGSLYGSGSRRGK
jgi:hypothetical protein